MTALPADGRSPQPLYAYVEELRRLGKDRFGERHGDAFLLLDTSAFRGRRDLADTTLEPRPSDADEPTAPTSFEVLPLRAEPGEAAVRIGRSSECEVVIHDQSVSSLHAIFERSSTGALSLRDAGSKNGTFVDERFVGNSAEAHPLRGRHALRFGSLQAVFLDLDALCDMAKLFEAGDP